MALVTTGTHSPARMLRTAIFVCAAWWGITAVAAVATYLWLCNPGIPAAFLYFIGWFGPFTVFVIWGLRYPKAPERAKPSLLGFWVFVYVISFPTWRPAPGPMNLLAGGGLRLVLFSCLYFGGSMVIFWRLSRLMQLTWGRSRPLLTTSASCSPQAAGTVSNHDVGKPPEHPIQFSLLGMLKLTTAAAVFMTIGRYTGYLLHGIVYGAVVAFAPLVVTMVLQRFWPRSLTYAKVTRVVAAGSALVAAPGVGWICLRQDGWTDGVLPALFWLWSLQAYLVMLRIRLVQQARPVAWTLTPPSQPPEGRSDGEFLPREELALALASDDNLRLIVGATVNWDDHVVTFWRGDLRPVRVPFAALEPMEDGLLPDFAAVTVAQGGQAVRLGNYEVASESLLRRFGLD